MDAKSIDIQLAADLFLLLLIGIGPKIALVPFLELTDALDTATKARVIRKMLTTAAAVAVVLLVLGEVQKAAPFLDRVARDRRRHHPAGYLGVDDSSLG